MTMAVTEAQIGKVEESFNKFAAANKAFRDLHAALKPSLTTDESLRLGDYLIAVRTDQANRKKYAESAVALDPKFQPVIQAAQKAQNLKTSLRNAIGILTEDISKYPAAAEVIIGGVDKLSVEGKLAKPTDIVLYTTAAGASHTLANAFEAVRKLAGVPTAAPSVAPAPAPVPIPTPSPAAPTAAIPASGAASGAAPAAPAPTPTPTPSPAPAVSDPHVRVGTEKGRATTGVTAAPASPAATPATDKPATGKPTSTGKSSKDCTTIDLSSAYTVKKGDTLHAMVRHENQKDEVEAIKKALQTPKGKIVTTEDAYAAYERLLMQEIKLDKASKLEVGTVIPALGADALKSKIQAMNLGDELAKEGVKKTDTAAQYGLPANGGKAKGRDC